MVSRYHIIDDINNVESMFFFRLSVVLSGNRPENVEKYLKKSLADLNLAYVDLYLIHVPFGFPESETGPMRHPNGDIILDTTTDHIAVWRVCITNF